MTRPDADRLFLDFQLALAGRYSIDREIGRGGSGIVYLAREVHLDRLVAIKLLPPERSADQAIRERFLREARLAARLSHPNIVPIHAVAEEDAFVFYVMAFVDGESLADRIRTRGPLGSAEGARILREVAWALAHAHAQGLVHRDVKPDNILIESPSGRALMTDFGIAAATQDVAVTTVSGTPEFMSPEQALGKPVDGRSDVYSLGVTAFHMLTGRLPFEGTNPTEVIARHVTEPAPPVGSLGIPVARKLGVLIDRCLAKDPDHRPESADAVAERLGVVMEQRRELPAALRSFVKRDARVNGGGALLLPPLLLLGSVLAGATLGPAAGFAVLAAAGVLFPLSYFVDVAGKMVRLGFAHADIPPAFAAEAEQGREERAVVHGVDRSPGERLTLVAAVTSAPAIVGLIGSRGFGLWRGTDIESFLILAGVTCIASTVAYLVQLDRRRDVDTDFWAKVWSGGIGRFAFAVARGFVGRAPLPSAVTHRATELSLGMAAESLWASLPASLRSSLKDLPRGIRRLQHDAQQLRELYDELNDGVSAAAGAADSPAYRDLVIHRDRVQARLTQAVAALETIRLNLLRLHAGSGTVESLTTDLDVAAEVSRDIARLIDARREVDRTLSYPRETATTPA